MKPVCSAYERKSRIIKIHKTLLISLPKKFVVRNEVDCDGNYAKQLSIEFPGVIKILLIPKEKENEMVE